LGVAIELKFSQNAQFQQVMNLPGCGAFLVRAIGLLQRDFSPLPID
jgi:hypothetical protein